MKKLIFPLAALLLVGLLAACSGGTADGVANSKEVTIQLAGNATTGYSWEYTTSPDGIVEEVSRDYVQDPVSDSQMVGVGGTYIFVFKGLAEGQAEVVFNYAQSWDTSTQPAETVTYVLTVDKDLNVTVTEK